LFQQIKAIKIKIRLKPLIKQPLQPYWGQILEYHKKLKNIIQEQYVLVFALDSPVCYYLDALNTQAQKTLKVKIKPKIQ
jgi:hypothetical protein